MNILPKPSPLYRIKPVRCADGVLRWMLVTEPNGAPIAIEAAPAECFEFVRVWQGLR